MGFFSHKNLCRDQYISDKLKIEQGLPWRSSSQDSALPVQGARVRSLVGELDPAGHNEKSPQAATKTRLSQINKYFKNKLIK